MDMGTTTRKAHVASAKTDIREITRRLNSALGATLVASLAGSKDPKISYKWARADGPEPRNDVVRRLQFAHTQWLAITASEGDQVARMWFIGSNPLLDYDTPVDVIREDRFKEAATAAAAMVEDGFLG
ncbi:hypothetical protein [Leifsonia sp. C5G2]|uniref:hypothetical protein n=1 Tax=Leifsonia sp. C5G2 TaxID=2735269 RepID=UPI00158520AB|nr:hypothetical protein [Leifsonia sp. C5G2]NUU06431.1 hypothetical protein [Leifsonia sp. C5G2]